MLGGKVPSMVWLPPGIRQRKTRVDTNGVVTNQPHSQDEINARVLQADPIGLLIAIMNGQPIPRFRLQAAQSTLPPADVKPKADEPAAKGTARQGKKPPAVVPSIHVGTEDGLDVFMDFEVPTLANRERIAMYLSENFSPVKKQRDLKRDPKHQSNDKFEMMLDQRAREARGETND